MFGVLTMHLNCLVNNGHLYKGAEDLFELLSVFPLKHSFFHLFQPKRNVLPFPRPSNNKAKLSKFYFIKFDKDIGAASGKYHSDVGMEVNFESHPTEGLKNREQRQQGLSLMCNFLPYCLIY